MFDRLWKKAGCNLQFASPGDAVRLAFHIQSMCEVCQACKHTHQRPSPKVEPTPVPPHVLSSVAVDLFVMPEVEWQSQKFNVFAACVDRHSG